MGKEMNSYSARCTDDDDYGRLRRGAPTARARRWRPASRLLGSAATASSCTTASLAAVGTRRTRRRR
jgi:hypothetical protein